MSRNHNGDRGHHILLGLVAGTVVGALAAAAVNTTKAQEFKEDLEDAYCNARKKISGAVHSIGNTSQGFSNRFLNRNHHSHHVGITIGAIAGGILGLSALAFLASDSGKGVRSQIAHTIDAIREKTQPIEDIAHLAAENFGSNISPWMKKVEKFLNAINENEYMQTKKRHNGATFDKIIDWAVAAAQTYQSLKK